MEKENFDLTYKELVGSSNENGKEIKIMVKKIEDSTNVNGKVDELKIKVDLVESKEWKEKQENLNNKYSLKNIKS